MTYQGGCHCGRVKFEKDALLNDAEHAVLPASIDAVRGYEVRPMPWSRCEDVRQELAA